MTTNPGASPKSPRYFYRNAHHALSMMIDHDMKFLVEHYATKELLQANVEWLAMHIFGKLSGKPVQPVRLFVHPDSLHLLEPQVGDVCVLGSGCVATYVQKQNSALLGVIGFSGLPHYGNADSNPIAGIIQRNGIAFHWPESEAA